MSVKTEDRLVGRAETGDAGLPMLRDAVKAQIHREDSRVVEQSTAEIFNRLVVDFVVGENYLLEKLARPGATLAAQPCGPAPLVQTLALFGKESADVEAAAFLKAVVGEVEDQQVFGCE